MSHKRNCCAHQCVCQKSLIKLVYICTNAVCFVCMHSSHQINICVCITTNIFKASETYHIRIYIQYNDVMHSNELIKQILSFWRRKKSQNKFGMYRFILYIFHQPKFKDKLRYFRCIYYKISYQHKAFDIQNTIRNFQI